MTETIVSIFIGVFTGVVASILIWIVVKTFNKIIVPWYQNSIYRGINLSGNWIATHNFPGEVNVEQEIILQEKGHKITGSLVSQNYVKQKLKTTTSYSLVGEIFDNYIDVEYKNKDKRLMGRGSQLLKVKDGGKSLEGGLVVIDVYSTEVIVSGSIKWKRKDIEM